MTHKNRAFPIPGRKKQTLYAFSFLLFFLLFFTGCMAQGKDSFFDQETPSSQTEIIGAWRDESGLLEFVFEKDGSLQIKPLAGPSFSGTYTIQEDQLFLSYSLPFFQSEETFSYGFSGDGTVLQIGNARYQRL